MAKANIIPTYKARQDNSMATRTGTSKYNGRSVTLRAVPTIFQIYEVLSDPRQNERLSGPKNRAHCPFRSCLLQQIIRYTMFDLEIAHIEGRVSQFAVSNNIYLLGEKSTFYTSLLQMDMRLVRRLVRADKRGTSQWSAVCSRKQFLHLSVIH